MKELDIESGIGLIEKKRQGQGKPTMIYLKQFMIQDVQKCNNYTSGEKSAISEVKNLHVLKCKNVMSRSEEITHPEVKKLHTNKNNINNTELNAIESLNSTYRKLNRQRSVFPSDTALLKALYLATFEATKKWTTTIRDWGQVYGELSIMYEGRLPE